MEDPCPSSGPQQQGLIERHRKVQAEAGSLKATFKGEEGQGECMARQGGQGQVKFELIPEGGGRWRLV